MEEAPNLIVLGPGKTGTTALYHALLNAGFGSLGAKEFSTFSNPNIEAVRAHIHPLPAGQRFVVDVTPSYFRNSRSVPETVLNVYEHPERLRFVVLYRDPVERAESDFLHRVSATWLRAECFEQYVCGEGPEAEQRRWNDMIEASRYRTHLREWLKYFSRRQILILESEKMMRNDPESIARLSAFLDCSLPNFQTSIANEQMTARFPFVSRFLNTQSELKTLVKRLVPHEARRSIVQRFHEINHRPVSERSSLTAEALAALEVLIGPNETLTAAEIRGGAIEP
jgi:hypothetical protein